MERVFPKGVGVFGRTAPLVAIGLAALLACAGSATSSRHALPVPDLFVMNADGSGEVQHHQQLQLGGRSRLVARRPKDRLLRDQQIVVANADGSNPRVLQGGYNPAWSPNGKKIAFSAGHGNSQYTDSVDIYVMNADGSGTVNLTRGSPAFESQPSWSPDGKRIAYTGDPGGGDDFEICVMRANGTGRRMLTDNRQYDSSPAWSPNGATIAFARVYRASAERLRRTSS